MSNLSRIIVALQVERVVARITTACSTCFATNFGVASCSKVEPSSTFCNNFFQLATLTSVARQVEHAVVIRATTRSTCNATMMRDKLNKNVAHITGLLVKLINDIYVTL